MWQAIRERSSYVARVAVFRASGGAAVGAARLIKHPGSLRHAPACDQHAPASRAGTSEAVHATLDQGGETRRARVTGPVDNAHQCRTRSLSARALRPPGQGRPHPALLADDQPEAGGWGVVVRAFGGGSGAPQRRRWRRGVPHRRHIAARMFESLYLTLILGSHTRAVWVAGGNRR